MLFFRTSNRAEKGVVVNYLRDPVSFQSWALYGYQVNRSQMRKNIYLRPNYV